MSKRNEFFITADGIEFSVLKNEYDMRNYDKKFFEFYEKNYNEIVEIYNSSKIVVRKNTKSKKCYKVLQLNREIYKDKFDTLLFRSVSRYVYEKHPVPSASQYSMFYSGWCIEELPYIESDKLEPKKSISEMQAEFLAKKSATVIPNEDVNFVAKELLTYKSKSYINKNIEYRKAIDGMTHIYDGLSFMTEDGSFIIRFAFRNLVVQSDSINYQTFYNMSQVNTSTIRTKPPLRINELLIPKLLEDMKLIPYVHSIAFEKMKARDDEIHKQYMKQLIAFRSKYRKKKVIK